MNREIGWLDVAGYLEGTLKSSSWVDILPHYERHFAPFLDADIEILEIGVDTGSSLVLWKQMFSRARFIGVDINPACRRFEDERVKIEIGGQDDPGFLMDLARRYRPTIIIDDGSHLGHHVPFTFERLFPALPPGGLYVIEDMFFHLYPSKPNPWMGYTDTAPHEYLFELVRLLFTEQPDPAVNHGMKAYLRSSIDEIAFAPLGVAFIRKKALPVALDQRLKWARDYALTHPRADVMIQLAKYIQRYGGSIDEAVTAAQKGVSLAPMSSAAHSALALMFHAKNDINNARAAAEKAAELEPKNWSHWLVLARLQLAIPDFPGAESSLRKVLALNPDVPEARNRLEETLVAHGRTPEVA